MNLNKGDTRLIVETCLKHGLLRNQAAYVLATALHETAHTMKPVRETLAKTDAKAKEILTKAWKAGKLPWVKKDYWSDGWFGRGYVQLTHKANYERAGKKLGVDLVKHPSLAMEPKIAAEVLVLGSKEGWFTGRRLLDFMTLTRSDYVGARKIINGTDKADLIAGYAKQYDVLLKAAGYGAETVRPIPAAPVEPPKPATPIPVPPEPYHHSYAARWPSQGHMGAHHRRAARRMAVDRHPALRMARPVLWRLRCLDRSPASFCACLSAFSSARPCSRQRTATRSPPILKSPR
jgi:hypothetical protein